MDNLRRQFVLPEGDWAYLDTLGLPWETITEGQAQWLILYGLPLPAGYTASWTDVALRLVAGYPDVQIDMAYFTPNLIRADGRSIGSISSLDMDGKVWQQWSRHRAPDNVWRPGEDGIGTHLKLVNYWLEQELKR